MRLLNFYLCWNNLVSRVTPKSFSSSTFHVSLILIFHCGLFLIPVTAAPSDVTESHLLPPIHGFSERQNGGSISGTAHASLRRDQVGSPNTGESERSSRAHKEIFRLELLRQIKAIDHMKCFPKVLCGLSVDSDKSFGINKSNFVKSYLELMRNIKPPQEGVEERLRTEDEVEGELLWPFSPHNPDRKHHSSFERISSGAMSASVELGDSPEYISRGLDSRVVGDTSTSVEKVDRMGLAASAEESKEKFSSTGNKPSSHASITRTDNSKIPGEKKQKDNANKSLTAKLTSYFTSWLPEISFVKDTEDESKETRRDNVKRVARSMSDEENVRINSNWPLSRNYFLAQLSKMLESFKQQRVSSSRQGRADEAFSTAAADHVLARDGIHGGESAEHEGDIYHTAVNIGKRLKDPKQCDYIYNGCPLEYNKILDMISSIRTDIKPDDAAAEALSHELGLEPTTTTTSTTTTTTTTSTTTTRKPQRKKTRPSTKIMHVLPNGEKVEINFRLGGSEDSEESSSSQRDYAKKETTDDDYSSSEKDNKGDGEVVVVDLGQRSTLSTDEVMSSEKRVISNRKGAPVEMPVVKNKFNKRKTGYSNSKKNVMSEVRTESRERSEELDIEQEDEVVEVPKPSTNLATLLSAASSHNNNKQKSALKLSGLTLTTNNNDEQPLEISPSYVIIKHQPLSVHTSSLLPPDNLPSPQQQINANDRLQSFQLIQNGQLIDADQLTDHLKNYIRQNGGIIPKLSLHSSGLLTTDSSDNSANTPNSYSLRQQQTFENQALTSSALQKHQSNNPLTTLPLLNARPEPSSKPSLSHLLKPHQFKSALPQSPYSSYLSYANNGPAMVGSVPGRLDSLHKATTPSTTTTTTTTSTTTESIVLPGMQETLMLDTDEITDDTMDKLSSQDTVPNWITPASTSSVEMEANKESEEEQTMLENLNKTYLNESGTRTRYKNPKKKKTVVKANSSRVRNPPTSNRSKGTKKGSSKYSSSSGSEESLESERVVIKHAGPYSGSPTVYQSPLKGPGPHGGAYPYLKPNVFPGYPFWRM